MDKEQKNQLYIKKQRTLYLDDIAQFKKANQTITLLQVRETVNGLILLLVV